MKIYKTLDEMISSTYSVDIGLSEEQAGKLYIRMLENDVWRNKISEEVKSAISDNTFSWLEFFERHDVYSAESEDDAREYAERIIHAPLMIQRSKE